MASGDPDSAPTGAPEIVYPNALGVEAAKGDKNRLDRLLPSASNAATLD